MPCAQAVDMVLARGHTILECTCAIPLLPLPTCPTPILRQANDMVLAKGAPLEWFYSGTTAFANHWSRLDGCSTYRGYLRHRIERDVVSHNDDDVSR